jgi:hypothetical protein
VRDGAPGGAAGARGAARDGRPLIAGTALDARTGELLGGVRVEGPDGTHAVSRKDGRFTLEGLAVGARGRVVATLEDGRRAERAVGPLEAGERLEIVLRLERR